MGKLYDNPVGPGHVAVHDPNPQADRPPRPEEGRIVDVDLEHYNVTARKEQWLRCQLCPTTFRWCEPHICARLALEDAIGARSVRAVFCSRECWYEWASRGD